MGRKRRKPIDASVFAAPPESKQLVDGPTISVSKPSSHFNKKRKVERHYSSKLEQLPNEILEYIFLLSGSVNLACASPAIGERLSNRLTCFHFAQKVFCYLSTDRAHPFKRGHPTPSPSPPVRSTFVHIFALRHSEPPLDSPELVHARNTALQCRWMTWDLWTELKEAQSNYEKAGLLREHFSTAEEYDTYLSGRFDIALGNLALIPPKLLVWPISQSNRCFIHELCDLGARVDWIHTLDGERVRSMVHQAIIHDDLEAMRLLMRPEIGHPVDVELFIDMMQHCSEATVKAMISKYTHSKVDWMDKRLWRAAQVRMEDDSGSTWPENLLDTANAKVIGHNFELLGTEDSDDD